MEAMEQELSGIEACRILEQEKLDMKAFIISHDLSKLRESIVDIEQQVKVMQYNETVDWEGSNYQPSPLLQECMNFLASNIDLYSIDRDKASIILAKHLIEKLSIPSAVIHREDLKKIDTSFSSMIYSLKNLLLDIGNTSRRNDDGKIIKIFDYIKDGKYDSFFLKK